MQASVRDLGEVVVLIVVADIVCERIQRPIVAIRLLALQARALCQLQLQHPGGKEPVWNAA